MELHERLRQYNRWRRGEDWHDGRGPDPKELGQLIDEAATALEDLRRDQAEEEALRTRMANLLTQTAAALRGPPPKNVLWDWSDLPERAAAAIAAIDVMQRAAAMAAVPHGAPSVEAAQAMGEKGGPIVEAERLAFEAWMRGHCWALSAVWDGSAYRGSAENGNYVCPWAIQTRRLWAAWRDRAALATLKVHDVMAALPPERECCGTFPGSPHRITCEKRRGKKSANAQETKA